MGKVQSILDFLHDEFEDELHVFLVSLLRGLILDDFYMIVEELSGITLLPVFQLRLFGYSENYLQKNRLLQFRYIQLLF